MYIFLAVVDILTKFNFLFMLPQDWIDFLRLNHLGISEFFSILFILYESVSILKICTYVDYQFPKIKGENRQFTRYNDRRIKY